MIHKLSMFQFTHTFKVHLKSSSILLQWFKVEQSKVLHNNIEYISVVFISNKHNHIQYKEQLNNFTMTRINGI